MFDALIVVDVQNEFSPSGQRPVANHEAALAAIRAHVERARSQRLPIAWVRHYNKPHESQAFVPGSWGAELSPGLAPQANSGPERLFEKDVFGAFTTTDLESWLRGLDVNSVLVAGFYAHMCLSTTVREALVRGFDVHIDPEATGARGLEDSVLGRQSADEVLRSALLHVQNMGAVITSSRPARATVAF